MYWNSFTYYENFVRGRVEKYFFDTPSTAQPVDKSTFIEGGKKMDNIKLDELHNNNEFLETVQLNPTEFIDNIMNEYGTEIKRLVYSYIKNPSDADDVTQEVFELFIKN